VVGWGCMGVGGEAAPAPACRHLRAQQVHPVRACPASSSSRRYPSPPSPSPSACHGAHCPARHPSSTPGPPAAAACATAGVSARRQDG
jgi:hypothetical protein